MGKYTGIITGWLVIALGLAALIGWRHDFAVLIKGSLPILLIFGGVIAVIAGFSQLKDEADAKKEEKK